MPRRKTSATPKPAASKLPPNVTAADLKYPEMGHSLPYEKYKELGLERNDLTFYETKAFGWVLCTLHISNASRRQAAGTTDRSYAIGVADGKVYRVGRGPHVLNTATVYLSVDNLDRLMPYVELYRKGLEAAGSIRDRISSRRAQGQLHRAAGRTHWYWNA